MSWSSDFGRKPPRGSLAVSPGVWGALGASLQLLPWPAFTFQSHHCHHAHITQVNSGEESGSPRLAGGYLRQCWPLLFNSNSKLRLGESFRDDQGVCISLLPWAFAYTRRDCHQDILCLSLPQGIATCRSMHKRKGYSACQIQSSWMAVFFSKPKETVLSRH